MPIAEGFSSSYFLSCTFYFVIIKLQFILHLIFFFHERTKHIEIDRHFVHDKVANGFIKLMHLHSQHQLVDAFTKALPSSWLFPFLSKMAIKDIHNPS